MKIRRVGQPVQGQWWCSGSQRGPQSPPPCRWGLRNHYLCAHARLQPKGTVSCGTHTLLVHRGLVRCVHVSGQLASQQCKTMHISKNEVLLGGEIPTNATTVAANKDPLPCPANAATPSMTHHNSWPFLLLSHHS